MAGGVGGLGAAWRPVGCLGRLVFLRFGEAVSTTSASRDPGGGACFFVVLRPAFSPVWTRKTEYPSLILSPALRRERLFFLSFLPLMRVPFVAPRSTSQSSPPLFSTLQCSREHLMSITMMSAVTPRPST